MKEDTEKCDEFYIGYASDAPPRLKKLLSYSVLAIGVVISAIALLISSAQQRFSSAVFEYGISTEVEGQLFLKPIPYLLVEYGKDASGNTVSQSILLVGYGKAGVQSMPQLISEKNDRKKVRLRGSLLYGDGKSLLQVTETDVDKLIVLDDNPVAQHVQNEFGTMLFTGEIIDPKCYFGVMKPGEGKPHRSCAIRCISGGIPPVFHTITNEYFVLTNEKFGSINEEVLDFVGDRLVLTGRVTQVDDLKILAISTSTIKELNKQVSIRKQLFAFEEGMTLCTTN